MVGIFRHDIALLLIIFKCINSQKEWNKFFLLLISTLAKIGITFNSVLIYPDQRWSS